MEFLLDPMAWLSALGIFLVRVLSIALDTVRMISVLRGKKVIAWVLGVATSMLFVLSIGWVMSDLSNPLKIVAYSVGFATGTVVGMNLEKKMAMGHMFLTVISSSRGAELAEALRNAGYAVTEIPARGKDGMVSMLELGVERKDMPKIQSMITGIDPDAFITSRDIEPVHRGYWGNQRS
ncbi:MAG: DUF2179 domain-containing protein [Anaerolineaceae bacterium]|nr:MAG: DUF2179 domain-containing protein [Anaerolineaceae bacterium]